MINCIKGLVSTIIPVYNRPQKLVQAVKSVLNQTYQQIEIIIVDDGSTDDTLTVAQKLAEFYPDLISVVSQKNSGPGTAREKGRQLAKGEFIQYLDSDDILLPHKFELQVEGLIKNPDCDVSYGMCRYRYPDDSVSPQPVKATGEKQMRIFPLMLKYRWWDTLVPLYRKSVCDQVGSWTNLRLEEDWEYDCRVGSLGIKLHYCPEYICEVSQHEEQRLSRGNGLNPLRLKDRSQAHQLIYRHAIRGGMTVEQAEMKHFARELFLLSRQCGAAGLAEESQSLFELAKQASTKERASKMDFYLYEQLANLLGWCFIGKFSCWSDKWRYVK